MWDKIHNHCYAHLRARARQIKSELKSTKKGTRSVNEYVTQTQNLPDSLTVIGVPVFDSDLYDIVLDGLPEEYNSFVMMMYGKLEALNLTKFESLLMLQQAQFDKYD